MGLRLSANQIDGTSSSAADGTALSNALVSVGPAGRGGTGSFVSADGLMITNHHVALEAVRQASSVDSDFVANGFVARTREEEIGGSDYEAWITRSTEDVSSAVQEACGSEQDSAKRAALIQRAKAEIVKKKTSTFPKDSTLSCRVIDMWPGRIYVLFVFERLLDVRIVYVPPFALGCFGGDTDNYEWPRHTADFALFRACVLRMTPLISMLS